MDEEVGSFHDVGRLLSEGAPSPQCVDAGTAVAQVLELMASKRFSQVPVTRRDRVVGVFSLWSLVRHVLEQGGSVENVTAGDLMDPPLPAVGIRDSLHSLLELVGRNEAVLVESPEELFAIVTSLDLLQYFYRLASAYILVGEIERALRDLIILCAGDHLDECISRIDNPRRGSPVPSKLHDMTFEDYRSLIIHRDNWPLFAPVLGTNRDFVGTRLERTRRIRNEVMHFREDLAVGDYQLLAVIRHWLQTNIEDARAQAPGESETG